MDFIGTASGTAGRIPAPNLSLSPEMLCKNYPFDFLVQPIVPLLSPPISEKPSFCLSIPALKDACLVISESFPRPTLQVIGAGILATCVSYGVWKVSLKMSEGIFAKESEGDIDTEKLDEEVARILSTIPEECTISTSGSCSNFNSQRDILQRISTTSTVSDRFSQESLYSCGTDVGKPLKQLQSRIDQVMSRVEVVISSLKILEDNMSSPRKDGEREVVKENDGNLIEEVPSVKKEKPNVIEVISLPEDRPSKMPGVSTIADPALPNKMCDFYLVGKQKSTEEVCLETAEKENLVKIHQRIKNLEARVENLKDTSQEKKTSPCESIQSSFCSDRWDKSSSVSIISEQDQEIGTGASSPRSLPITVHSLISPCPEQLTPPSDLRRLNNFKNLKRNSRSRPINFTQFPTIEEDPLSYSEMNISCDKADTTMKVQNPGSIPNGEFLFARQWDTIGDAEYNAYKYTSVRRQETWPRFVNQHRSSESSFCIPKINTFNSQFKQSENSCFEAAKPAVTDIERPHYQKAGITEVSFSTLQKPQNSPRSGTVRRDKLPLRSSDFCFNSTSPVTSGSTPQKSQNSPRHAISRKEKMQRKSVDTGFNSKSPMKCIGSTNTLQKNSQCSEIAIQMEKAVFKTGIEKLSPQQSNNKTYAFEAVVTNDNIELKAPKHKLITSEVDAPLRKVSRGNVEASESSQSTHVASDDISKAVLEAAGGKGTSTPTHGSERLRRLSPFKRNSKKNNNYQVKYMSKKGGEDSDKVSSVGQGDKEDEWIVIVPNDQS